MPSGLEYSIETNLRFYKKVAKTIDGAKSISSEVETEEEYGGGPSDDLVREKIEFKDIDKELQDLLQEIKQNEALISYTKRESLAEIADYCRFVLSKEALSEEGLIRYSSQENPTIVTASDFLRYQENIKMVYEITQAFLNE